MKVAVDSLGCKLNQAEIELLIRQFTEAGYTVVPSTDKADVYILNTCTVTHVADSKSRHMLRLAHRRNPDACLVVIGCYAERARQELARIDGVDLILGNEQKPHLLRLLEETGRLSRQVPQPPIGNRSDSLRTRAFIKVQDGCHNFCSYCIVPFVRCVEQSVPLARVVAEIKQRVADGCIEAVLTGTEVGLYNCNGVNLKSLLEHVLAETDIARLRLSSLQPREISPGLVGLWHDSRLCPHFHLSLQSGHDEVLRRMKRRYSTGGYRQAVSLIRELLPEAAITTDVIVGFPGETDEEFRESCDFCRRMDFARIHVFPYSPRPGTEAEQLPQKITDEVKRQRSRQMLALAEESARNFRRRFAGRTMEVLWEQLSEAGVWSGLTGNYIKVYTESNEDLTNKLLPVKLGKIRGDGVWGEIE